MSRYRRGADAERELMEIFKKRGYSAQRTAGSHSPWDITITNKKETILAQVKRVKGKYYSFKKDIDKFKRFETSCKKVFCILLDRAEGRKRQWKFIKVK